MLGSPFDLDKEVAAIAARREVKADRSADERMAQLDRDPANFGTQESSLPSARTIDRS